MGIPNTGADRVLLVSRPAMFCEHCACRSCMNTLDHTDLVQRQRQAILARSPKAFEAKVGLCFPCRIQTVISCNAVSCHTSGARAQHLNTCRCQGGT